MKSSPKKMVEQGRIIARELEKIKVDKKKNMIEAVHDREKMLHDAADSLFK